MERQLDVWQRVDQHLDQPVSIKLERGQKGGYGWEIKVYAENNINALEIIKTTDYNLRVTYLEGGSNEKPATS